jgi:hypothetical protein
MIGKVQTVTATQKPGVFTGWLWLIALFVICLAAWAAAGVIIWLVYP